MAEVEIDRAEFLTYAKGAKAGHLCRVRFCRSKRRRDGLTCPGCELALWRARNPTKAAYHTLKGNAKRRGTPFALTFEEFREAIAGTGYRHRRGREADALHLDRVDPTRGYEPGNVRVCTASENCSKGTTADRGAHEAARWADPDAPPAREAAPGDPF